MKGMGASVYLPLATLAAAMAALFATPAGAPILGLSHGDFTRAAFGATLLLWLLLTGARRARPGDMGRAVGSALTWVLLLVVLVAGYAYRFEFGDLADRVAAEFLPSEPQVGPGGEVVVVRRIGGEFVVAGKVDNTPVSFLFDTGASTVVLRAQDAQKIGIDAASLSYDVMVTTANGSAMAAETRLDVMAVGPIAMRNVRALVARPGALNESLLGMSFLERLQSYTVERGRLILRAK